MGKKFIIQAAQVPFKYQTKPFPSVLKAVRSCYKPSTQQSPWSRLLAFVILPLQQNKPSIHVFHCRATKQMMEMPRKVNLCISSPLISRSFCERSWQVVWTKHPTSFLFFFHQRLTNDNLFCCIPPAMPFLGKAAAEAFLGVTMLPFLGDWAVGRQADQTNTTFSPSQPGLPGIHYSWALASGCH